MSRKVDMDHISLLCLSLIAMILPFRDLLSEFVFTGFKVIPDLIVVGFLAVFLFHKKMKIRFDLIDVAYVAFIAFAFITTILINHEGIVRFILQIRSICLYYILYYMIKNLDLKDETYESFGKVLSIVVYLVVTLSVVEVVTNKQLLFPQTWSENIIYYDNFIRAYSMFNNPNTYAAFLIFSFIYKYQITKEYWSKNNIVFTIMTFLGIYISVSRSTLILLILFLVLRLLTYLIQCKKNKESFKFNRYVAISLLLSLLCWGAVTVANNVYLVVTSSGQNESGALDRFGHMFNDQIVSESSTDGRIYNIKKGIEIFQEYKITGTGFGTYGSAASLMKESSLVEKYDLSKDLYSDNEYIVILVETGIIGTILFLLFLFSIIWKYHKDWFKLAFCIVFAGLGMFYNVLEVQPLAFLFWTCLAIPSSHEQIDFREAKLLKGE